MESPRITTKLVVAGIHEEPGDVRVIKLKHPHRPFLPTFELGSHVNVRHPTEGCVSIRSAVSWRISAATG